MDLAQLFIEDLGWVFFAAWAAVLTTVAVITFGRDILPFGASKTRDDR
jgi:hypothetical protein